MDSLLAGGIRYAGAREPGHPRHEVPGELPLLLFQPDLFDQDMEMPDQGRHDLPEPGFLDRAYASTARSVIESAE